MATHREFVCTTGRGLGLLPPPLAGEGWGGGEWRDWCVPAPSLSLPRKRGRGRCGANLRNTQYGCVSSIRGAEITGHCTSARIVSYVAANPSSAKISFTL